MKAPIAVIDYGMGNLRSVQKALEKVGAAAQITRSPGVVRRSPAVVLPGVGSFGEAARRLRAGGLWRSLCHHLESGKPFLGICLGFQLLFQRSEESPAEKGLGFFQGQVVRFRMRRHSALKIPHMGWNTIQYRRRKPPACLIHIPAGSFFYFVHSFYPVPQDSRIQATETVYGEPFCSSISQGALFGCQFHPEKSGRQGLQLLRNFVQHADSAGH